MFLIKLQNNSKNSEFAYEMIEVNVVFNIKLNFYEIPTRRRLRYEGS